MLSRLFQRVVYFAVVFTAPALLAQDPSLQYTRVLLPIVLKTPIPGALGSLWTTEFLVSNTSAAPVSVFPYYSGGVQCGECPNPLLSPKSTGSPFVRTDAAVRGTFLYIDRVHSSDIEMSLRVRDLSRVSQTWGTAIPIVREDEFRSQATSIIDIPNDPDFRSTLRIYGLDGRDATPLSVRLYGRNEATGNPFGIVADSLLGETTLTLSVDPDTQPSALYPTRPAFLELSGFDSVGNPQGFRRLRVEITPLREGKRVWAFVSVTNNTTQHVTVLSPLDSP